MLLHAVDDRAGRVGSEAARPQLQAGSFVLLAGSFGQVDISFGFFIYDMGMIMWLPLKVLK